MSITRPDWELVYRWQRRAAIAACVAVLLATALVLVLATGWRP